MTTDNVHQAPVRPQSATDNTCGKASGSAPAPKGGLESLTEVACACRYSLFRSALQNGRRILLRHPPRPSTGRAPGCSSTMSALDRRLDRIRIQPIPSDEAHAHLSSCSRQGVAGHYDTREGKGRRLPPFPWRAHQTAGLSNARLSEVDDWLYYLRRQQPASAVSRGSEAFARGFRGVGHKPIVSDRYIGHVSTGQSGDLWS